MSWLPLLLKIASAILSVLTLWNGGFAAAGAVGLSDVDPSTGLMFSAGTGIFAFLTGLLGFFPALLGKIFPFLAGEKVQTSLSLAVKALTELAADKTNRDKQRAAIQASLTCAFDIAQAIVQDPQLDELLAKAMAIVNQYFFNAAPKRLEAMAAAAAGQPVPGQVLASAPASIGNYKCFAEVLAK